MSCYWRHWTNDMLPKTDISLIDLMGAYKPSCVCKWLCLWLSFAERGSNNHLTKVNLNCLRSMRSHFWGSHIHFDQRLIQYKAKLTFDKVELSEIMLKIWCLLICLNAVHAIPRNDVVLFGTTLGPNWQRPQSGDSKMSKSKSRVIQKIHPNSFQGQLNALSAILTFSTGDWLAADTWRAMTTLHFCWTTLIPMTSVLTPGPVLTRGVCVGNMTTCQVGKLELFFT